MTQNYFLSAAETAAVLPDIAGMRGCAPFHAGGEPGWILDEETYAAVAARLSSAGIDPRRFEESGVYGLVRVRLPAPAGAPAAAGEPASGTDGKPKRKRKAPAAPAEPVPAAPTFESTSAEARARLAAAMGVASVAIRDGKGERRKPAASETAVVWMNSGIPSPSWHGSTDTTRVYFEHDRPVRRVLYSVGHGRIVNIPNICSGFFIEVVGNEIFVGLPLMEKDPRELAFFSRVLNAVSKEFEDDAALRAGREASFDAARASVVPLLSGIHKRRTADLDRTLSNRQHTLAGLVREKSLLTQQAAALSASLEAMERVAAARKEALAASFAEMAADPKVAAVWGRSNVLHVKTVPLACEDSATGRVFDVGSWTFCVQMDSGAIQWEGDGPVVDGIRHPKVSRDGHADFGPLAEAFAEFFAQGDLARHIGVAISFLENVDSSDPLGSKILAWPEIQPEAPASIPDAADGAAGEADGGENGAEETAEESTEAEAPSVEAADGGTASRMRAKLKSRVRGGAAAEGTASDEAAA